MTDYEYRVLVRPEGSNADWSVVYTNRGAGRPFRTLSAARGVITRERKDNERLHYRAPHRFDIAEYKIQRRPVTTDWEDVE